MPVRTPPPRTHTSDYFVNKHKKLNKTRINIDTEWGGDRTIRFWLIVENNYDQGSILNFVPYQGLSRKQDIYIEDLIFTENGRLSINGLWRTVHSQDSLYIRNLGQQTLDIINHIDLDGYKPVVTSGGRSYFKIKKSSNPWTPAPEPTTCVSVFSLSIFSFFSWRKRLRIGLYDKSDRRAKICILNKKRGSRKEPRKILRMKHS